MEGAEPAIEQDLRWLGLGWDEGPVRQSERRQRHLEQAGRRRGRAHPRRGRLAVVAGAARVRDRAQRRPAHVPLGVGRGRRRHAASPHVIRGNDHLPNAALQIAAVRSLGAEPPRLPAPRAGARRGRQAVEARRRRLDRGAARGGLPAGGDREPAGAGGELRAGGRDVAAGAGRAVRHRPAGARRGGAREQAAAVALDRPHIAVARRTTW